MDTPFRECEQEKNHHIKKNQYGDERSAKFDNALIRQVVCPLCPYYYILLFLLLFYRGTVLLLLCPTAPHCVRLFSSYSVVFRYSFYRLRTNEMEDGFDPIDLASFFLIYHVKVAQ